MPIAKFIVLYGWYFNNWEGAYLWDIFYFFNKAVFNTKQWLWLAYVKIVNENYFANISSLLMKSVT